MSSPERITLDGPAGPLEACLTEPQAPTWNAVVAHPHPLYGGDMENLVVLDMESALLAAGARVLRFNFRGVGGSGGSHDEGRGERADLETAIHALRESAPDLPTAWAGYSFGAAMIAALLQEGTAPPPDAVLLAAPPITHYDFTPLREAGFPVDMVWGSADALTPAAGIDALQEGAENLRARILPDAEHDLGSFGDPTQLRRALRRAVRRLTPA